jgi:hypothetical protein
MKVCKTCEQDAPFNPDVPRNSKAAGFMGNICWACYVKRQRARAQSISQSTNPEYLELKAKKESLEAQLQGIKHQMSNTKFDAQVTAKAKRTVVGQSQRSTLGVPYAERLSQAQSLLGLFERAYPDTTDPTLSMRKFVLEDEIRVVKHKIEKFGPDAFDYIPKKQKGRDDDDY